MTERLVRYQQCGEMHFLIFSCYRRLSYLGTSAARSLFKSALERIGKKYKSVIAGYVAMPEHALQRFLANPLISLTPAYTCMFSNAASGQFLLRLSDVKLWGHPKPPRNQWFAEAHLTGVFKL
jgi:hypothetical protein